MKILFEQAQIDPDLELVMTDSTLIRARACAAGYMQEKKALERSVGGFTTKIHTLVDALRRVFSRFYKLAQTFLSFVHFVEALTWFK